MFAAAERERCRKAMRKRRDNTRQTAERILTDKPPPRINLELLTTGLLSQWIDSNDPMAVVEAARRLESRGRRLAVATLTLDGVPIGDDFQSIPLASLELKTSVPLHSL
jgi:hypothetical protein